MGHKEVDRYGCKGQQEKYGHNERDVILSGDAVVEPLAMVIQLVATPVTLHAMLGVLLSQTLAVITLMLQLLVQHQLELDVVLVVPLYVDHRIRCVTGSRYKGSYYRYNQAERSPANDSDVMDLDLFLGLEHEKVSEYVKYNPQPYAYLLLVQRPLKAVPPGHAAFDFRRQFG